MDAPEPSCETIGAEPSPTGSQRKDLGRLLLVLLAAGAFHFGITVPRGPFEESRRNRGNHRMRFAKIRAKYGKKGFEDEPSGAPYREAMRKAVERSLGLVRSRSIARGATHRLEAKKLECRTLRCRFELCAPNDQEDEILRGLQRFEIWRQSAWTVQREALGDCSRFTVEFLQRPQSRALMTIRDPAS